MLFIESDFAQQIKAGQDICGDAVMMKRDAETGRVIVVLSDGLGSGVKANVLASMTASMALTFVESDMDFLRCAETMMDALPVCQERKIAYATFTIIDIVPGQSARIIEFDAPRTVLLRHGAVQPILYDDLPSPRHPDRVIRFADLPLQAEDRLVFFSDGVSQAGLGTSQVPLGWREEGVRDFLSGQITRHPEISARRLARTVVGEALRHEERYRAGDDVSCAVLYFRTPRRTLILTGPPYDPTRDAAFARRAADHEGAVAICGGTTAEIVGRELDRRIETEELHHGLTVPPAARMDGVTLVTEGILTMTHAARMLEERRAPTRKNTATRLAELLRESDMIEFLVGTRINEAHQDPNLPHELEVRRTVVHRLAEILRTRHLKTVTVNYA